MDGQNLNIKDILSNPQGICKYIYHIAIQKRFIKSHYRLMLNIKIPLFEIRKEYVLLKKKSTNLMIYLVFHGDEC
jgi:hypothetical protein